MTLNSFSKPSPELKLLAIEASTDVCSVAISNGVSLFSEDEQTPKAHTKVLLALVDRLLQKSALSLSMIDAFAVGCGPGSFTGIRIACSAIQALAYAANKPVVPISTLRILAQGAYRQWGTTHAMACLRSRTGEKYGGLFAIKNQIMESQSAEWVKRDEEITLPDANWQLVEGGFPSAIDLISLAIKAYQQGEVVLASALKPVYLSSFSS